jgi:hypothetical protein
MMKDSTGSARSLPFDQMRKDADELLRASQRARELFADRPPRSFGRLSTLLDEVLPVDRAAEARVARAVEMEPRLLSSLRAHRVDPLEVPPVPLASLGQTLALDEDTFYLLLEADHVGFQPRQGAARSTGADDPRQAFRSAWRRAAMDLPEGMVK